MNSQSNSAEQNRNESIKEWQERKTECDDQSKIYQEHAYQIYLLITPLIITLSVGAIGFVASYMLGNTFHDEQHNVFAVVFMILGVASLMSSCAFGFARLWASIRIAGETAMILKERYVHAAFQIPKLKEKGEQEKFPEHLSETQEKISQYADKKRYLFSLQIVLFAIGVLFLFIWTAIVFFG